MRNTNKLSLLGLQEVNKFGNIKMSWTITYFNHTVFDDILAMPNTLRARYVALTERMEMHGPNLGMPHTRAFGDGLFELRIKGREGIARVFIVYKLKVKLSCYIHLLKKC